MKKQKIGLSGSDGCYDIGESQHTPTHVLINRLENLLHPDDAAFLLRAVNEYEGLVSENAMKSAVINKFAEENKALLEIARHVASGLHSPKAWVEKAQAAIAQAEGRP